MNIAIFIAMYDPIGRSPIIETQRLIILPLMQEHAHGMFLMDSDREVHRYVGKKPVTHIEQTRAVIEFVRDQYRDNGIGRWAMTDKLTGEFVGWIGFKLMEGPVNGISNFYDFGYRLRQESWGKGLATEGSLACLEYNRTTLKYMDLYAMTDVNNGASRRVLEKVGFHYEGEFVYETADGWREAGEPATWFRYIHR